MNNNPVGVLDSGIGGMTVVREIIRQLPLESIVYIGDTKNSPYGTRSTEELYKLSKRLVNFLIKKNVKMIIVACNTITVSSISRLRNDYPDIPIIGTVPVVKKAAAKSAKKRIGILSTTVTANSNYQKELIKQFGDGCEVFNYGTDELVPMIEKGKTESSEMKKILRKILAKFTQNDIDTLALGCTHFPILRSQIQGLMGKNVHVLDSGEAIARQVRRVLENRDETCGAAAVYEFYLTGHIERANFIVNQYFDNQMPAEFIGLFRSRL